MTKAKRKNLPLIINVKYPEVRTRNIKINKNIIHIFLESPYLNVLVRKLSKFYINNKT